MRIGTMVAEQRGDEIGAASSTEADFEALFRLHQRAVVITHPLPQRENPPQVIVRIDAEKTWSRSITTT